MYQTASILIMTLSGLVGLSLAADKSLATLPVAVTSVGTAVMMIPASMFMKKYGRKRGFFVGIGFGFAAGILAAAGILYHSFWLFVFANMLIGCYQGFSLYYRFAAAEAVDERNRSKAISLVISGGVVAAIAGPTIAKYTQNIGEMPFVYSYLAVAGLSMLSFILVSGSKLQSRQVEEKVTVARERKLSAVMRQPAFLAAIVSSAVGYSAMIMVMTATPIAMMLCGHTTDDSATVIQWHVLGMFVPSFFTGSLIQRFGATQVSSAGVLILLAHVALALTGTDFPHFISGLILLGVGWNFMFIAGTTLLTRAYKEAERAKTQATHDFVLFGITSLSSFAAGGLLNAWGWDAVNVVVIPPLVLAFVVIQWFRFFERSTSRARATVPNAQLTN